MDYKAMAQAALEARASLVEQARSINDDGRLSDAEKRERIERVNADIEAKTAEARALVEQGEREAEARSLTERAGKLFEPTTREARDAGPDLSAELRSLGRGEGLEISASGSDFRAAGVNTAKTTDSAWAGATIQNTFIANVLQGLRDQSPILQSGARVITTASGEKMEWPIKNGNIVAAAVAEGATYGKSRGSFTRWALDAYKYGVIAEGTYEMLADSALDLAGIIATDLGAALADVTASDFLRGNGTTAPHGLVPATVLNTALANRAAITSDALVTFTHSVKPQYRRNASWYASDDFVLTARLLKDSGGRYVWQDSLALGQPDTLLGKPVTIDPFMDVTVGAGKVPAIFGDFSKFLVRFVGSVNVSRSDEYGWDSDIVAWKGSVRVDSGLTDAAALSKLTMTA